MNEIFLFFKYIIQIDFEDQNKDGKIGGTNTVVTVMVYLSSCKRFKLV